ncbi:hypothetical protein M413DRAFT_190108 [Hebeloma cylindrosporum]|uniref:Uncharacterized protein n=1 Tax=Hebeloma cylindrosporum TaxID=76867 RepID=A0A0C2XQX2_HEBCY|nr:hypothetical protein M413DRAFT_190108 [Hebeloma cylindrosporum h7]
MSLPTLFISLVRMHHISNPSKFRRLKRFALQANVSGLVKIGKPGVLVFDGERECIRTFLESARGLRYLDFHHVDTKPFPNAGSGRVADAKNGLREVSDMKELIRALDIVGEKEWFRRKMGMIKGI